jgi:hypothetical protein
VKELMNRLKYVSFSKDIYSKEEGKGKKERRK